MRLTWRVVAFDRTKSAILIDERLSRARAVELRDVIRRHGRLAIAEPEVPVVPEVDWEGIEMPLCGSRDSQTGRRENMLFV